MTMGLLLDTNRDSIGARLRHARFEAKLTTNMAGEKIGVARNTVETWERNENIPSGFNLLTICEVYKVSADWLLFGTGNMTRE